MFWPLSCQTDRREIVEQFNSMLNAPNKKRQLLKRLSGYWKIERLNIFLLPTIAILVVSTVAVRDILDVDHWHDRLVTVAQDA